MSTRVLALYISSPRKRQRTADVEQTWLVTSWIRKRAVGHLHDCPRITSYTHQGPRGRERKLDGCCSQRVIRLCFGVDLDKLGEITRVINQLFCLVVNDIGRNMV